MYPRREHPYPIPPALPTNPESSLTNSTSPNNGTMAALPPAHNQQYSNNGGHSLQGLQGRKGDRIYSLVVEQQPIRARMCGFGDKDRRPITPPPCIRLIVTDANTGKEVDFNEVDSTFFVLTVDLWSQDGQQEVNLVRHSSGAPTVSISTSTTTSYPPPPDRQSVQLYPGTVMPIYRDPYSTTINSQPPSNPYGTAQPVQQSYYPPTPNTPVTPAGFPYSSTPNTQPPYISSSSGMSIPPPPPSATGMFTRNLIGSLTVNAFRLTDTDGKVGFWFVLQDLSVRTEGQFRLKMNFVDVGSGAGNNTLNTGRAPVLATTFSDVFQVYSAKKFPGVIESTPLSKAFASQGIKIPIRKEGPKQLSNQAEYDADD